MAEVTLNYPTSSGNFSALPSSSYPTTLPDTAATAGSAPPTHVTLSDSLGAGGTSYSANRLSEGTPSLLCPAQRLRAVPYAPLTPQGVDEAIQRAGQLKTSFRTATENLVGLYTALNGYCGIYMADPTSVEFSHTQYYPQQQQQHQNQQHLQTIIGTSQAAGSGNQMNAGALNTSAPPLGVGVGVGQQQHQPQLHHGIGIVNPNISAEDALEAFRAQQLSQNKRRSAAHHRVGVCNHFVRHGTCPKGNMCPYSHVVK